MSASRFTGTPMAPYRRPERGYYRRKNGFPCDGCNKTCLLGVDYYMVHDSVWAGEAGIPPGRCMLCISCLESRLGRTLTADDYAISPLEIVMRMAGIK